MFIHKSHGISYNCMNSKPVWLCQWVTCLSWQLYWWTLAESKVEYCMQKTWSFWYMLNICCGLHVLTFCLCQEQCVQEGEWPKQELTVLQWADWAIPVYSLQMSHGKRDVNSAAGWAKFSSVPVLRLQKDIWTCSWIFIYQYGHIDELCH